MSEELSGRRIVVPETRELDQLVRMLEERGAEAILSDDRHPRRARRGTRSGLAALVRKRGM
jgi:hypothetical protein